MKESAASERAAWFRQAAVGMFIHWGVSSVLGRGAWVMHDENIPADEYAKLADRFNPRKYSPEAWAALAREAGMNYMVLTTRHHDGYSLFDSQVSDFTATKSAAGRDLVGEYVEACRKAGLKVGFYYSVDDWHFPRKGPKLDRPAWRDLVAYVHAQVEELMTRYGRVDVLWYDRDGGRYLDKKGKMVPTTAEDWETAKLNAMVRKYQPHILINNRWYLPEDFDAAAERLTPSHPDRLWESSWPMNNHWGWFRSDPLWKPTKQLVHMLTACAHGGGNFLLNVGPKSDGTIPAACVKRLSELGRWLRVNGEAIYGVKGSAFNTGSAGCAAACGKTIYIFVHWWPGRVLALPKVDFEIKSARILGCSRPVAFERKGEQLLLKNLPARAPDRLTTTIALDVC